MGHIPSHSIALGEANRLVRREERGGKRCSRAKIMSIKKEFSLDEWLVLEEIL